jgi:hypothetical protein
MREGSSSVPHGQILGSYLESERFGTDIHLKSATVPF